MGGLAVGDGPCRRFGTPTAFSSYFELEIDEICAAPESAGGIYVGVALQSGDEIFANPKREFDGWLLGGSRKALICRAGTREKANSIGGAHGTKAKSTGGSISGGGVDLDEQIP